MYVLLTLGIYLLFVHFSIISVIFSPKIVYPFTPSFPVFIAPFKTHILEQFSKMNFSFSFVVLSFFLSKITDPRQTNTRDDKPLDRQTVDLKTLDMISIRDSKP